MDQAQKVTSVSTSDSRPGGDLGVDISSFQPLQTAPAALHLSRVPENMRSVGHEPPVDPLPSLPAVAPHLVYEPEAGTFVPDESSASSQPPADGRKDTAASPGEGLMNQVVHKAEGILEDVKGLAGTAFGEIKDKASDVWHAVAGSIGAGPGKELGDDNSERVVAGMDHEAQNKKHEEGKPVAQHGMDLGVNISSYQPPVSAPAGLYPHGEIRKGDATGHRASEVVGAETVKQ